jgi:hypothetical protein
MIPQDKANHMIGGALIALIVLLGIRRFDSLPLQPREYALGAAIVAGAAKEAADWLMNWWARKHGKPVSHGVEGLDFAFTAAGGALIWGAAS